MANGVSVHKLTRPAHSKTLCILELLEGQKDLTDKDKIFKNKLSKSSTKARSGVRSRILSEYGLFVKSSYSDTRHII